MAGAEGVGGDVLSAKTAVLNLALFMLLYVSAHAGLTALWERVALRRRLGGRSKEHRTVELGPLQPVMRGKVYIRVADALAAVGWEKLAPESLFALSALLGLAGVAGGAWLLEGPLSALLLGLMLAMAPFVLLWMRLTGRQLSAQLDFLPAVEQFYQSCLVTGRCHVRAALQKTVEARRLPGAAQAAFEQLSRNLSVGEDEETSVRRFCLAFGHAWADYFGNILRVALAEGNDVTDNLRELISDMRRAQLAQQWERHRLLEIRLANFTPALFLALFVIINFRMNYDASYQAYVTDPHGRTMLLNAMALIFGSFVMGLYLSRRRM